MEKTLNFIAIEGGDGSGKGTQAELTSAWVARDLGKTVLGLSFPSYGRLSAYYAEKYLNGNFGSAEDVSPDLGVLAFALDRFASKSIIEEYLLNPNGFVVTDRYVASNLAHQGSKISDEMERHEFYDRTLATEYDILKVPKPNLNLVLLVPTYIAQANVDKKGARSYTTRKRDIHEESASHLYKTKANYEELCRLYPDEFTAVQCIGEDGQMRSVDDIQAEIQSLLTERINSL